MVNIDICILDNDEVNLKIRKMNLLQSLKDITGFLRSAFFKAAVFVVG